MRSSAEKLIIAQRQRQVSELCLRGWSQQAIADHLGVAQKTISLDLKTIRRHWQKAALVDFAQAQAVELQKIEQLERETWVHSANKMGKTFVAALAAVWWFATRQAKVVTSSATEQQLNTVLWGEIDHLLRTAVLDGEPFSFGFKCSHLRIWLPSQGRQRGPQRKFYLVGQVAAQVESFQGHHLQPMQDGTGTVLFVFEEASSLEREFYEAATSQAHRILAVGNPLRSTGVFLRKVPRRRPAAPRRLGLTLPQGVPRLG